MISANIILIGLGVVTTVACIAGGYFLSQKEKEWNKNNKPR